MRSELIHRGAHVFVAMPYNVKDGIDFNAVYDELIEPALEEAGFEVFRADEELRAGEIRTDMFQELLLADLVVVDVSIDNPNVWYELGVRHALRSRGVIQIQSRRDHMPFDVYTDRTLRYGLRDAPEGARPDPERLEADREALAIFAVETMNSWHGHKISPVYHLLQGLSEPDWRKLEVSGARRAWEEHEGWKRRVHVARKRDRPGDVLVLADEVPTWVLRLDAIKEAGKALRALKRFDLALDQYEKALRLDPVDLDSRRQKGILLGRLGRRHAARAWLEAVVEDHPGDAETWALLGRVGKDAWQATWRQSEDDPRRARERAAASGAVLREAIRPYVKAFSLDPSHYYSGVNAATLCHLHRHLLEGADAGCADLPLLQAAVRWSILRALDRNPGSYWARVSMADLEVLTADAAKVRTAYEEAAAVADRDWFALDSSRQQLELLRMLGFRREPVESGLEALDTALEVMQPPDLWEPRQVILFSGHMIDAPDRPTPRFPAELERAAAARIAEELDELDAGPADLALCGAACGGDILFAQACIERGVRLELRIPFAIPEFLKASVSFVPGDWVDRFWAIKEQAEKKGQFLIADKELGEPPASVNPHARNNLWQLYSALAAVPRLQDLHFIGLWDCQPGDGTGGTQHMHDAVRSHAGRTHVIDVRELSDRSR